MAKAKKKAKKVLLPKVPAVKLPKFTFNRKTILTAVTILIVVAILYFLKGLFIAALVNGSPISRLSVVQELEKSNGSSVLDSLVTKELIRQEARKKGINVTRDEINSEISKIEGTIKAQGQTLDEALAAQGWTKKDLEDQIVTQKIVEKLLADKVLVTDQEVDDYVKANKSTEPRDTIKEQLRQQKLFEAYQAWIQGLMAQAKINYFVKY